MSKGTNSDSASVEISAHQLLEEASKGGDPVGVNDLRALKRHQMIPPPRQVGRGQGRGSVALFPVEAVAQVRAAMELRKKFHRVDDVIWGLWWQGFQVPVDLLTDYVARCAAEIDQEIENLRAVISDPDAFDDLLQQAENSPLKNSPVLRSVRKRTGRAAFPTVIRIVAEVMTGDFNGLQAEYGSSGKDSDEGIVDKAFGVVEGRKRRILDVAPWLTRANDEVLRELSNVVSSSTFSHQATATPLHELAEARDEFKQFSEIVAIAARWFRWLWGTRGLGFGVAHDFLSALSPSNQVVALLMWRRLMEDQDIRRNAQDLFRVRAEVEEAVALFNEMVERSWPPRLAALLSPKSVRRAFRSEAHLAKLEGEVAVAAEDEEA